MDNQLATVTQPCCGQGQSGGEAGAHRYRVGRGKLALANEDVDPQLREACSRVLVRDARPEATKSFHHLDSAAPRESNTRKSIHGITHQPKP